MEIPTGTPAMPSCPAAPGWRQTARLGPGTRVWADATIGAGAELGAECIVGERAFIDAGVRVGRRCKIQNSALLYAPAVLEDGVFIGPAAILTNDRYPRAITPDGERIGAADWIPQGVVVRHGASVGAAAVVVAGVEIGAWALVAAGALVDRPVPAHALVAGVPARQIGWVGRSGHRLLPGGEGILLDPVSGDRYQTDGKRAGGVALIPLSRPLIGPEESAAVARVLSSGQLAAGPEVAAFEAEFAALRGGAPCGGRLQRHRRPVAGPVGGGDRARRRGGGPFLHLRGYGRGRAPDRGQTGLRRHRGRHLLHQRRHGPGPHRAAHGGDRRRPPLRTPGASRRAIGAVPKARPASGGGRRSSPRGPLEGSSRRGGRSRRRLLLLPDQEHDHR